MLLFVDPADPGAGFHDDGPALVAREPEAVEHARMARGLPLVCSWACLGDSPRYHDEVRVFSGLSADAVIGYDE